MTLRNKTIRKRSNLTNRFVLWYFVPWFANQFESGNKAKMHDANEAQQKTTYLVPIVRHNRTDGRLKRQELSIVQLGPVPNQCVEESGPAAQVSGGRQLVALVLRSSIRQMQNLEAKRREMFFVWTSLICSVQDKSLHCIFSRKLQAWFVPPPPPLFRFHWNMEDVLQDSAKL